MKFFSIKTLLLMFYLQNVKCVSFTPSNLIVDDVIPFVSELFFNFAMYT